MIRSFIILFLFVLAACSSGRKEHLFLEYVKSYNKAIKIIDSQNEIIYNEFNFGMTNIFYGNPIKTKPWYEKAMSIKQKANKIIQKIDSLENTLGGNLSNTILSGSPEIDNGILKKKIKLNKSDIVLLKSEFVKFQQILIAMIRDTTYKYLIESVNNNLDTSSWNLVPCLTGKNAKLIEALAVLAKLKTNIKCAELDVLGYLQSNIMASRGFKFYKIEAIVEPNALIIPQGRSYSANIFMAVTDSTVDPMIFVEGKELDIRLGKGIYKENTRDRKKSRLQALYNKTNAKQA